MGIVNQQTSLGGPHCWRDIRIIFLLRGACGNTCLPQGPGM